MFLMLKPRRSQPQTQQLFRHGNKDSTNQQKSQNIQRGKQPQSETRYCTVSWRSRRDNYTAVDRPFAATQTTHRIFDLLHISMQHRLKYNTDYLQDVSVW